MERTYWMLVSSPENFELSRRRGFDLAGMKSRHGKKAADVRSGDKVVYYLTGVMGFGGVAEITGTSYYSEELLWGSRKAGEAYPHRFPVTIECAAEPDQYLPAAHIVEQMQHTKKWPSEHWRLAFQGNVHRLTQADYDLIKQGIEQLASMPVR
ncbi:MAG: EVE domain-containing protein [Chloroflexota bacterium]|nr:EVE domain-containing protein [Chloroflexota bacterium]